MMPASMPDIAPSSKDLAKAPLEVIHHLEPGVGESPLTFRPEHVLDVVIPYNFEPIQKPGEAKFGVDDPN